MRCRPGDLAVIVRAEHDPDALGAIVTVKRLQVAMGLPAWEVEPKFYWICPEDGKAFEICWDDEDLDPIRPDADPVETETEREVTA